MKLATTLTVVAFVSVFMLELSVARYRKEKEPECKSGEVAMPSMTGGFHCRKKKAPLLKCEGKEAGECKRICQEKLGEFQKDCAHLTHCDRAGLEPWIGSVCNDLKSCRSDDDCDWLGYAETSGSAERKCKDKGDGKKCYFSGGIIIS